MNAVIFFKSNLFYTLTANLKDRKDISKNGKLKLLNSYLQRAN